MKNLVFVVFFIIFWILVFGNLAYAGDYTLNVTDRSKGKSIQCVLQEVGGNRVVICSEREFVLSEPFPVKKSVVETPKISKKTTGRTGSSFLELISGKGK